MLTLLKFLEGTVIKESVEDLWERSFKNSAAHEQQQLTDFDRKFYTIPYAPKIYRDYDDQLDLILRADRPEHHPRRLRGADRRG